MDNGGSFVTPYTPQQAGKPYIMPDQAKAAYEYAKALMYGSGQQPVHHWTQGLNNMVAALVGGNLDYNTGQKQRASQLGEASQVTNEMARRGSFPDSPEQPAGYKNTAADGSAESSAISANESGGNYRAIGNPTKTGDRAYGKYQVMGANVPQWTQEALGRPMSPMEFLNNPDAQEAVFKKKFGEYEQKYGPEGAARAWFAGEGGMNNPNARDVNGMTVARYAQNFDRNMGDGGPTAFNGNQPQAEGTQAIAAAMKPRSQPNLPEPQGGHMPIIDPRLIKPQSAFTPGEMTNIVGSNYLPKEVVLDAYSRGLRQGQPLTVPFTGGNVLVDPTHPGTQQFIPDLHWGTNKIDTIEHPGAYMFNPYVPGGAIVQPNTGTSPAIGPRSEAEPTATPTKAEAAAFTPEGGNTAGAPENASGGPEKPVKVASLNPTDALGKTAATSASEKKTKTAIGLPQFAQAGPPPGMNPQDWAQWQALQQAKSNYAVNEDAQKKAADFGAKKYDVLSGQANAARQEMPNLDLALAYMNDPRFHSGILSGPQDLVARLKAGLLGDQYANAPNEAFDKLMSGHILGNMRTALGGLGQVRLAEINLLSRANANRNNTDASNRAVIEISKRAIGTLDHLDQLGQMYASGDEVTDPISGQVLLQANTGPDGQVQPRHGLDVGFDKLAAKFVKDHPSFTPEEIKHYETIFDTGRNPDEVQTPAPGKEGKAEGGVMEKQFSDGKGGTVTGVSHDGGKTWQPK